MQLEIDVSAPFILINNIIRFRYKKWRRPKVYASIIDRQYLIFQPCSSLEATHKRIERSNKNPFNQKERAEAVNLLGIADGVLLLQADELMNAITELKPNTLVLGNEFKDIARMKPIVDKQYEQGGSIQFHAGDIQYATADLLSSSEGDLRMQRRSLFKAACNRQGIKQSDLQDAINSWESTRLIVLGDTIVDQYAACEAIGMSAEAPVVVVRELEHKNFIGGAAVVAAHICALGAKCDFISVVGTDNTAELVKKELKSKTLVTDLHKTQHGQQHSKKDMW